MTSVKYALRKMDREIKKLNGRSDFDAEIGTAIVIPMFNELRTLRKVVQQVKIEQANMAMKHGSIGGEIGEKKQRFGLIRGRESEEISEILEYLLQVELRLISKYVEVSARELATANAQHQLKRIVPGFKRTLNKLKAMIRPEGYEGFCQINDQFLILNEREYLRAQRQVNHLLDKLEAYLLSLKQPIKEVKTMRLQVSVEISNLLKGQITREVVKLPGWQVQFRNLAKPQSLESAAFVLIQDYMQAVKLARYLYRVDEVSEYLSVSG